MRKMTFDMTGYHPGAASMRGWIVNNHPLDSLNQLFEEGAEIEIRNFHKIGYVWQYRGIPQRFIRLGEQGFRFPFRRAGERRQLLATGPEVLTIFAA